MRPCKTFVEGVQFVQSQAMASSCTNLDEQIQVHVFFEMI